MNSGRDPHSRVLLPLLERLSGDQMEAGENGSVSRTPDRQALRESARRCLESLLNARQRRLPLPDELTQLARSPLGYGIPDVTAGAFADETRRTQLVHDIERAIRRFEPRFIDITVEADEFQNALERTLRLRITATIQAKPEPEPVRFETLIEATAHKISVEERN